MIELRVTGESMKEIMQQISGAASSAPETPSATSTKKDKASKPAEITDKTEKAAAPVQTDANAGKVTAKDVGEIIPKVVAQCGKPVAVELLAKYGAKRGQDLKEEQYADFVKDAKAKLA